MHRRYINVSRIIAASVGIINKRREKIRKIQRYPTSGVAGKLKIPKNEQQRRD